MSWLGGTWRRDHGPAVIAAAPPSNAAGVQRPRRTALTPHVAHRCHCEDEAGGGAGHAHGGRPSMNPPRQGSRGPRRRSHAGPALRVSGQLALMGRVPGLPPYSGSTAMRRRPILRISMTARRRAAFTGRRRLAGGSRPSAGGGGGLRPGISSTTPPRQLRGGHPNEAPTVPIGVRHQDTVPACATDGGTPWPDNGHQQRADLVG